jgi:hypothetical protein
MGFVFRSWDGAWENLLGNSKVEKVPTQINVGARQLSRVLNLSARNSILMSIKPNIESHKSVFDIRYSQVRGENGVFRE